MNLQNLSIKRKLMLITMLTSSVALVLSSASFLIYDLISFRHLLTQDLMTQAQIIGYNSAAAMAFKDEPAATATLSALTAKEDIVAAVLYSPDGKMFAHYFRNDKTLPDICSCPFARERLPLRRTAIWRSSTTSPSTANASERCFCSRTCASGACGPNDMQASVLVFVLISGFFALLVSSKLQKVISGPILHLEDTMRMVSANKNYEVRAVKSYSRRNRKPDRWLQHHAVRNSAPGYGVARRQ